MNRTELDNLKRIASDAGPESWFQGYWSGQCFDDHMHGQGDCNYRYEKVEGTDYSLRSVSDADRNNVQVASDLPPRIAAHVAAFHPKTALALIARIEALEEVVKWARKAQGDNPSYKDGIRFDDALADLDALDKGDA